MPIILTTLIPNIDRLQTCASKEGNPHFDFQHALFLPFFTQLYGIISGYQLPGSIGAVGSAGSGDPPKLDPLKMETAAGVNVSWGAESS